MESMPLDLDFLFPIELADIIGCCQTGPGTVADSDGDLEETTRAISSGKDTRQIGVLVPAVDRYDFAIVGQSQLLGQIEG